jgi:RNA polymerase sigma-70 factor (ECF subfamily)
MNRGQKVASRMPRLLAKKCAPGLYETSSPPEKTAARYGMPESNVKVSIHRGLEARASVIGRDSDE